MQWFALWLLAVITAGLSAAAARAHAFLDHAVPPVGGTVAASPPEIRLYFSEAIDYYDQVSSWIAEHKSQA
jgi:methionine-rich copper-binding protein CopC